MEMNVGATDRVVRLIGGIVLLLVGFLFLEGWLSTVLIILGIVLFITGLINRCALYYPFGISTRKATSTKN